MAGVRQDEGNARVIVVGTLACRLVVVASIVLISWRRATVPYRRHRRPAPLCHLVVVRREQQRRHFIVLVSLLSLSPCHFRYLVVVVVKSLLLLPRHCRPRCVIVAVDVSKLFKLLTSSLWWWWHTIMPSSLPCGQGGGREGES